MNTVNVKRNPYDWINPVDEPTLFAGRKEELATIEEHLSRLADTKPIVPMVAVVGERRVGKTSMLRRIDGICQQYGLKSILASLGDVTAGSTWEFWHELFSRLLLAAREDGILIPSDTERHMGFRTLAGQSEAQTTTVAIRDLWFPSAYAAQPSQTPPDYVLGHDLEQFVKAFLEIGRKGIVVMLDEAHLLGNAQGIKQQIRHAVHETDRCGIVFAGEPELGRMFNLPTEPFFGQARVVPLKNFTNLDDVAECALLPLSQV